MSDPIPVSFSAIAAKQSQAEGKEIIAQQVSSEDSFEEAVDTGFNPGAVERQQARLNRFRKLETRQIVRPEDQKIAAVEQKAEEDLSHSFYHRNPELDPDRLRRLRASLRQTASPQEILDEVQEVFQDPTLADEAMEYLERSTTGDLKDAVSVARGILQESKGREILAGRNIAPAVKSFHDKGLGTNPTELRDLYRDITGSQRDHNTLFSELSNKYPFDDLKTVVSFLLKGMGYDLKAKGPSIQQAELMLLMTEVRNLQSILWVYLFFKGRMKLLASLFKKSHLTLSKKWSFELLSKEFIKLVEERYPSVLKLLKQLENMDVMEDEARVIILTQFRDAIRALSPRVYKSVKSRQDLLLVILETLEEIEAEIEDESEDEQ